MQQDLGEYEEIIQFLRVRPNPLDEKGVSGLSVEWHPNPGYGTSYLLVALTHRGDEGRVLRKSYEAHPDWQGDFPCPAALIRKWVARLERLGIWSQDHYRHEWPEMTMVDPEWYIVRVKDAVDQRERVIFLSCPDEATSPSLRPLFRSILSLAHGAKWRFEWRCWLHRMFGF